MGKIILFNKFYVTVLSVVDRKVLLRLCHCVVIVTSIFTPSLSFFGESKSSEFSKTEFLNIAEASAEFLICYLFLTTSFLSVVVF